MEFTNYKNLPQEIQRIIDSQDFIGYVRTYYRNGYGSRFFFKGAANGMLEEIKKAEEVGRARYTDNMKTELQSVCEELFETRNPKGRYELYDFCERNDFDKTASGYMGYCYLEHIVCQIVVSKEDDYFCRVYFYSKNN